jgi:hypothetical protein
MHQEAARFSASFLLELLGETIIYSPQRQLGFSPFIKQIQLSAAEAVITITENIIGFSLGGRKFTAHNITTTNSSKTPQPCHAQGNPQPHPYFFAGNQIFLSFMFSSWFPLS